MQKTILFLTLSATLLLAKPLKPKVMQTQDNNPQNYYSNSYHIDNTDGEILSSTAESFSDTSVELSLQGTTKITSDEHRGTSRMSYLDNNRIEITQNIANGEGEYLTTLLTMLEIPTTKKNLEKIQKSFDELVYLSHNDFLNKLQALI